MNIYIGNLSIDITERDLKKVFREFGEVVLVRIIKDRLTGNLTRFGFVEMPNKAEAQDAIRKIKRIKGGGCWSRRTTLTLITLPHKRLFGILNGSGNVFHLGLR